MDNAYADPGNTYITFRIQPDIPVEGSFSLATFDLTSQSGVETGGGGVNIQCAGRVEASAAQQCVMDSGSFAPDAGGQTLTLRLEIYALYRVT